MGLDAFTTRLPMGPCPAGGRSPGLLHMGSCRGFCVGGTLPVVGSFQGCLVPPLCFCALNILEVGGLQIALLETADRKPCQCWWICFILMLPWGMAWVQSTVYLTNSPLLTLLLHPFQKERDGSLRTSDKFLMSGPRRCKYQALSPKASIRKKENQEFPS